MKLCNLSVLVSFLLVGPGLALAQEVKQEIKLLINSPDEPIAKKMSLARTAGFLDLRQAGVPASDPAIQKVLTWLKSNQRESGRWFTKSINTDRYHFITHAGTAYAVLALKACE